MNKKQKNNFIIELKNNFDPARVELIMKLFEACCIIQPRTLMRKSKPTASMPLSDWEKKVGARLNAEMLRGWCKENGLARSVVEMLVSEFRTTMIAKNKEYADFRAAFQIYLIKNYLSMSMGQAQEKSRVLASTEIHNRGVNL